MAPPIDMLRTLLRSLLPELWDRRWIMLAVAAAVGLVGTVVIALLPNQYTSTARVYVDTQSLLKPLLSGLTVQPDVEQQLLIMRQTLLTRPNMEELIRMTDLDLTVDTPVAREELIQRLMRELTFKMEGRQLFSISFTHNDPDMAQRLVQSLLTIFVEQNLGTNRRDIEQTQRFIGEQIAEYESRLRETEQRVAGFRSQYAEQLVGKEALQRTLRQLEGRIGQLENELQSAIWSRDQLGVELARTPEADAQGQAAGLQAQLAQELAMLRMRYTDDHPDVKDVLRRIEAVNGMESAGEAGFRNPVHRELTARIQEQDLKIAMLTHRLETGRTEMAEVRRRMDQLPSLELELAEMNRDYEVLKSNYQQLIERREKARLAQQVDNNTQAMDFRVVEPPIRPLQPSGPNRLLLMMGLAAAAIGAGIGVGLLLIQLREDFTSADQLRNALNVDVIGSVSFTGSAMAFSPARIGAFAIAFGVFLAFYAAAVIALSNPELLQGRGPVPELAARLRALLF